MRVSNTKSMKSLASLGKEASIYQLSDPLLNTENNIRILYFRNKKGMGTSVPMLLFRAMSLKLIETHDETLSASVLKKRTLDVFRQVLGDIYCVSNTKAAKNLDVMIGKTLQEVVFLSLTESEPLLVDNVEQLRLNSKENKAHIVCGNGSPTFTVPAYLCRYLLRDEGLNEKCSFTDLNPILKGIGRDTYSQLKGFDRSDWSKHASFSRRVQNSIMFEALKKKAFEPEWLAHELPL